MITENTLKLAYELYLKGKTYAEIGQMLNITADTISKKLRNKYGIIKKKIKKIDYDKFLELWEKNWTDKNIAEYFKCSIYTIKCFKNKHRDILKKISSKNNKNTLSYEQEQFILGSLLGDLCLRKTKFDDSNCLAQNSKISIKHCAKQKELFMTKVKILGTFMGKYQYRGTFDKRTGKTYYCYSGSTISHPIFTEIRKCLYINGTKQITLEFLNKITSPIALAFWFMDDGTYRGTLATNSFSEKEIDLLISWLKDKWNILATKQINRQKTKQYVIHISEKSRFDFEKLIFPYMIKSMYYKLKYKDNLK